MPKKQQYIIQEDTPEEANMDIQRRLSKTEIKVSRCDSSILSDIQETQANLSNFLYNRLLRESEYFEYYNQLQPSIRKFKKECVCQKK